MGLERSVVISDSSPLPLFYMGSGHSRQWGELRLWGQAVNLRVLFQPWDGCWSANFYQSKLLLMQALGVLWARRVCRFPCAWQSEQQNHCTFCLLSIFLPLCYIFCRLLEWLNFFRYIAWWGGIMVWLQVLPNWRVCLLQLGSSEDVSSYLRTLCQHQSHLTEAYLSQRSKFPTRFLKVSVWIEESSVSTEKNW